MKKIGTGLYCFFMGLAVYLLYAWVVLPKIMSKVDYMVINGTKYALLQSLVLAIPMMIGAIIIGIADAWCSDKLKDKIIFAVCFGFCQTFYPLLGDYIIHRMNSAWFCAFSGIGVSVSTVCLVYLFKHMIFKEKKY